MDAAPNQTLYISNLYDKLKKDGESAAILLIRFQYHQLAPTD